MRSIITISLLLSMMAGYGQALDPIHPVGQKKIAGVFFSNPDSLRRDYDTIPSIFLVSDTSAGYGFARSYKGYVIYQNDAVFEKGVPFTYYFREPEIAGYLRFDKKPLFPNWFVWDHRDSRQCDLQPIKGM